jgi:hypothetical protein
LIQQKSLHAQYKETEQNLSSTWCDESQFNTQSCSQYTRRKYTLVVEQNEFTIYLKMISRRNWLHTKHDILVFNLMHSLIFVCE